MPLRLVPNTPITILAIWRHIGGTVDWMIGSTWTAYYSTASTSISTSNASDFSGGLSFTLGSYREPDDTLMTVAAFSMRGTNDLRGSANGGPIVADTSVAAPSGVAANVYFGSDSSLTGNKSDSIIRALATWNRAFSDADLIALSGNPWQVLERTTRRIYLPAAAGGTDILATTGTELWSGLGANINAGISVAANTGVETWNGLAASINARVSVTAGTGVETWNGIPASVAVATGILATTGVETWNGIAASVSLGGGGAIQIQATTGTELWGGLSATVTAGGAVVGGNRTNRIFRPKGKRVIYRQ